MSTIKLMQYNYDVKASELVGEVDLHLVAKNCKKEDTAKLLSYICNSFNTEFENGVTIGKLLQSEHRTVQATIVRFLLGIVVGLSRDAWTDPRNEAAVACGRVLDNLIISKDNPKGTLSIGWMI